MMLNVDWGGWLVVAPYDRIVLNPVPPLSNADIRRRYRGFDGNVWPLGDEQLPLVAGLLAAFGDAKTYYEDALRASTDVRLQYLSLDMPTGVDGVPLRLEGYDFGVFASPDSYFSCVLNELLYGVNAALRDCLQSLNESLLFDSLSAAARFGEIRRALVVNDGSLEVELPGEEYGPIAVGTPIFAR